MKNEYAFSKLHPVTIFLYFISLFFVSASFNSPMIVVLTFIFIIILRIGTDGFVKVLKQTLLSVPLVLFCALINMLINHRGVTPFLYINDKPITVEAAANGFFTGIMLVSLVMLFSYYNVMMPQHKFLYLFSKAAPVTALMISMTVRYIPLCMRIYSETMNSANVILRKEKGFFKKIQFYKYVFLSCVTKSLEYTIGASLAMQSKGYGVAKRSNAVIFKFKTDDFVIIIVNVLLDTLLMFFLISGRYKFQYYNRMSEINPDMGLAIFAVLYFIPLFIQVLEVIRWKLSQRKI